ncbi:hypothetical protein [Litoreibacter roseus]|nr:hypothetical protein [Litoreibacter roseus]
MADRQRSQDGSKDTDKVMEEAAGIAGQGRDGGRLAREIGSTDELKRATERPAGATRVTKALKKEDDQ